MTAMIFSIYDRVAEEFGPVFESKTEGVAIRCYLSIAKKDGINPDDYWLYYIGTCNHDTGHVVANEKPIRVITSVQSEGV